MSMGGTQPSPLWRPYLDPDELILWQGRPNPRMSWRGGEMGTLLLGAFVLGFIGFFTVEAWLHHEGPEPVWGDESPVGLLVWIAIGIVIGLSGPLGMRMVREGTWYTLTTRRAIIAHWPQLFGFTVYRGLDSYPVHDIEIVPSDLRGLQTVNFAWLSERSTFQNGWRNVRLVQRNASDRSHIRNHRVGFERVTNAQEIVDLCRQVEAAKAGDAV
jgi:hypothetical protein